jgi:hypothetical protein
MTSRKAKRTRRICEHTGKVRYRDCLAAKKALHRIGLHSGDVKPKRAYFCGNCKGWHLTKYITTECSHDGC